MASWWVPLLDDGRGRLPFITLHKTALGGEIVRMELPPIGMPLRFRGLVLVARAYTTTADVTLAIEDDEEDQA
jgi:hypothetical protein